MFTDDDYQILVQAFPDFTNKLEQRLSAAIANEAKEILVHAKKDLKVGRDPIYVDDADPWHLAAATAAAKDAKIKSILDGLQRNTEQPNSLPRLAWSDYIKALEARVSQLERQETRIPNSPPPEVVKERREGDSDEDLRKRLQIELIDLYGRQQAHIKGVGDFSQINRNRLQWLESVRWLGLEQYQ